MWCRKGLSVVCVTVTVITVISVTATQYKVWKKKLTQSLFLSASASLPPSLSRWQLWCTKTWVVPRFDWDWLWMWWCRWCYPSFTSGTTSQKSASCQTFCVYRDDSADVWVSLATWLLQRALHASGGLGGSYSWNGRRQRVCGGSVVIEGQGFQLQDHLILWRTAQVWVENWTRTSHANFLLWCFWKSGM